MNKIFQKSRVGKLTIASFLIVACGMSMKAKEEGVIMIVDGEKIPTEEFLYLYNKNNQQQLHPQSLDEYMNLFEVYRLKVAEAKAEGVDTTLAFKSEIQQYKKELVEPYVSDSVYFNALVDIAMEREKTGVESSHIMLIRTHDQEKDTRKLALIDSLRHELLNGADFIELAKTYSEDKFSSDKGGYLGFNPAGTFPYGFETAVYETPEGEISDIVESHVGWHIVKSGARKPAEELHFPVKSYAEVKNEVLRKSSSPFDSRFHEIRRHNMDLLKQKHKNIAAEIDSLPEDEAYDILVAAEEASQYANNSEYRNLIDEYINGSLLYEVSVRNVWDKASSDEEGLQSFYKDNKDNYKWETPHAKGILVQASNDSIAGKIKTEIPALPTDSVVKHIKVNYRGKATADLFNLTKGTNAIVDNLVFGEVNEVTPNKNYPVYFIIEGRIVETPENLDDVRSMVVGDYQELLESQWVNSLKNKHTVEVNKKELARIRKSMK